MAKVTLANLQPDATPDSRGRFLVQQVRGGAYAARAWPRPRSKPPSPEELWRRQLFSYAAKMASASEPIQRETAEILTRNTDWVWRDLLVRAAYGRAYEVTLPDGTVCHPADHSYPGTPEPAEEAAFMGALVQTNQWRWISATQWNTLIFDLAAYDTDDYWVPANPSRLTAPAATVWGQVTAFCQLGVYGTVNPQRMRVLKNGDPNWAELVETTVSGYADIISLTTPVFPLSAGDYLEVQVWPPVLKSAGLDGRTCFAIQTWKG